MPGAWKLLGRRVEDLLEPEDWRGVKAQTPGNLNGAPWQRCKVA